MPKWFTEISKLLHNQQDVNKYHKSIQNQQNFVLQENLPLQNRVKLPISFVHAIYTMQCKNLENVQLGQAFNW